MGDTKFCTYMMRKAESAAAQERYNHASATLELARIRERLAEINSQGDPLNTIINLKDISERERLYYAAYYVVTGRNGFLDRV